VYRGTALVSSPSQPGASVSGLTCGTTYTFAVDAFDAAGNRSTKASVNGTTAPCPDTQPPTAPTNVQATSRTANSIALSWFASSDNSGVVGYGLYKAGALVGTSTTTSGIYSGLTCNTNYTLAVDAYDAAGNRSSKTTVMAATTLCPDTSPPSTPAGLTVSNVSPTGFTLTWNASTDDVGVAGYDVYQGTAKAGSVATTSYNFAGLACGTSFTVGVVAYDPAGNRSSQSTTSAATSACSGATTWTFCANEGQRCTFTGTKDVRYGANSTWTAPRALTDGVDCNNQVFGDPLVGVQKHCEIRSSTSQPQPLASGNYPSSYYSGPLGQNNILPGKAGAFLIVWPDGSGWPAQQARVADLESRTGRTMDGIGTHYGGGGSYQGNSNCMYNSGERREQWIHDRGSYPIVSWSPDASLADVNSGAKDGCFRAAADYFKSFSFPIMLRMWWEFNGNWMGWSGCGQQFIDAWRRVVGIFDEQGATNVGFWWAPQEGFDRTCSSNSYPGDQYVDWVGSDAYNWCMVGESSCWASPLHSGWSQFGEIFDYGASSAHDTFGSRKPFVAGETATVYDPASPSSKGQWFRNIPAAAKQMEHLVGVQLFEVDVTSFEGPRSNWPVDYPRSDSSVFDGFVAFARDPYFNTR
jgi:chitodextrinase